MTEQTWPDAGSMETAARSRQALEAAFEQIREMVERVKTEVPITPTGLIQAIEVQSSETTE